MGENALLLVLRERVALPTRLGGLFPQAIPIMIPPVAPQPNTELNLDKTGCQGTASVP